ncbi:hypothetical protein FACS1894187_05160 [Synergistales bacterium]|nr:hypothetical protein FACS1894187_05160 [Synergistales bacterium]
MWETIRRFFGKKKRRYTVKRVAWNGVPNRCTDPYVLNRLSDGDLARRFGWLPITVAQARAIAREAGLR